MMTYFADINWLAVFVAAVLNMIIGALWYSPLLFGNLWMKATGVTQKQVEEFKKSGKSMGPTYAIAFVGGLVMSAAMAWALMATDGGVDATSAVQLSVILWFGFLATDSLSAVLWENKTVTAYVIGNAYRLVTLIMMALVLTYWQ